MGWDDLFGFGALVGMVGFLVAAYMAATADPETIPTVRRALALVAAALAVLTMALATGAVLAAPAEAGWTFGPRWHAPDLRPHWPHLRRCRGNDLVRYCRERHSEDRSHSDPPTWRVHPRPSVGARERAACARWRAAYVLRHPGRAPRPLRHVHGCRRWRLDWRYHSRVPHRPAFDLVPWLGYRPV